MFEQHHHSGRKKLNGSQTITRIFLILVSALIFLALGLFMGMIYGGNYGYDGPWGVGYEGAGGLGAIIGGSIGLTAGIYFYVRKVKIIYFSVAVLASALSVIIPYRVLYWSLDSIPEPTGKSLTLILYLLPILVLLGLVCKFSKMKNTTCPS